MSKPEVSALLEPIAPRTCLGCGTKNGKQSLFRFVAVAGTLVVEGQNSLPGRGAYCCRSSDCLARLASRKQRLVKVLRRELDDFQVIELLLEKSLE